MNHILMLSGHVWHVAPILDILTILRLWDLADLSLFVTLGFECLFEFTVHLVLILFIFCSVFECMSW